MTKPEAYSKVNMNNMTIKLIKLQYIITVKLNWTSYNYLQVHLE